MWSDQSIFSGSPRIRGPMFVLRASLHIWGSYFLPLLQQEPSNPFNSHWQLEPTYHLNALLAKLSQRKEEQGAPRSSASFEQQAEQGSLDSYAGGSPWWGTGGAVHGMVLADSTPGRGLTGFALGSRCLSMPRKRRQGCHRWMGLW
jgi:hypothetical protein